MCPGYTCPTEIVHSFDILAALFDMTTSSFSYTFEKLPTEDVDTGIGEGIFFVFALLCLL